MRSLIKYIIVLSTAIVLFSCSKTFENLQQNPNNPTSVQASLILGTVLTDMSGTITNTSATGANAGTPIGSLGGINSWDAVHRWNQFYCSNYNYYNVNNYTWQDGHFDGYIVLKNVVQMEKEARLPISGSLPAINPYEAIGKFLRAYYYYNMTSMFGDIPEVEALLGSSNSTPAYTPQKQVFIDILNMLDTANTHFASLIALGDKSLSTTQDIYYGGDITKWQKLVNSFKLRVLVSLSAHASDADLNVASQFANIINNPTKYPIFQSQSDDLEFVYQPNYNLYYFNPAIFPTSGKDYNMAQTYVQALQNINDPRLFVTAEPAWGRVNQNGYSPTDVRSFAGASTGEAIGQMNTEAGAGLYSFINRKRYYTTQVGDPDVLVGYKEMCFNIAEAINLGWISGSAETWYKTGITESFKFYGMDINNTNFTAYFMPSGATDLSSIKAYPFTFDFNTYYAQSGVKYASGHTGRNQIVLQKYIASFQNSGWEAYFNSRRMGIPTFQGGSGVGNNGVVPKRWAYPVAEQTQNAKNWKAALTNQGFSTDDLNATIWLIKQ